MKLLWVFVLFSASATAVNAKPWSDMADEDLKSVEKGISLDTLKTSVDDDIPITDESIEAIARRDYESAHGRILAVNMAHVKKRQQDAANSKDNNAWEHVEEVNEADGFKNEYFQGDIMMDEYTEYLLKMPLRSVTKRSTHALTAADQEIVEEKRNAVQGKTRLWHTRVIPYYLPSYMNHIRKNLQLAIAEIQSKTCLRIVPYVPGKYRNYITIFNKNGCASKVGRKYHESGSQGLSLGPGCVFVGTILHEFLHAIGFFHEQARTDRDKYVSIKWQNIQKGFEDQFDKYTLATLNEQGLQYDYDSIMHYGRKAFSKNRQPTIEAIGNPKKTFGSSGTHLSPIDVEEINKLYDCQTKRFGWTRWSEYTPCDKNGYKKRERYCYHSGNAKRQCGDGVNVYGIQRDRQKCTMAEIKARNAIHGNWGKWSKWTPCSVTCDDGKRTRTRSCNNPAPSKYGKKCVGKSYEADLCTVSRCKRKWSDADFEKSTGMWRSQGGQLAWRRKSGFTQTMNTGPMADHTTGKGYYMYIESSRNAGARPGYKAILQSKWLEQSKASGQCLKFYYTMYGKTTGSLKVFLRQGNKRNQIFALIGNKGPGWKPAMINLNVYGKYQLEIVGTVGGIGYSDIAIDDVYIDDGFCGCQDKYQSCARWARKDECSKNRNWMASNCARSCYTCRWCGDFTVECKKWAKSGECQKNAVWMKSYCTASCGVCKAPQACRDKHRNCAQWALRSMCSKGDPTKYLNLCPFTCNVCRCADNNRDCKAWAKMGECQKNPVFMHRNCKASCGNCA